MYLDVVVLSSLVTVALIIAFMGGFFYFIMKDSHKDDHKTAKKSR
ncbi:MAG: cytochrome c oxidase subunit CcoM [Saccharospirillum sp.]